MGARAVQGSGRCGVSVFEQASSTDWVTLMHMGEDLAEAWCMPEGEGTTVVFLVPRSRLDAGTGQPVSIQLLLDAADIPTNEVESWRLGDGSNSDTGLSHLLPSPADDDQLTVYVRLKPPVRETAAEDGPVPEVPLEKWHALDAVWKAILGLEASIDSARLSVDGLRGEMETAFKKALPVEDKNHALQADVAQWTKAKSRIHHAVPKAREFIHRATWSLAVPERKRLDEIVRTHIEPRVPFHGVDRVREQLEHLHKDRQVLFAQGNSVLQDCRGLLGDIQNALRTLQRNAADRARQKRSAAREKGKHG
jgi:uncharacterized protein YoxC